MSHAIMLFGYKFFTSSKQNYDDTVRHYLGSAIINISLCLNDAPCQKGKS